MSTEYMYTPTLIQTQHTGTYLHVHDTVKNPSMQTQFTILLTTQYSRINYYLLVKAGNPEMKRKPSPKIFENTVKSQNTRNTCTSPIHIKKYKYNS